VRRSEGGGSWGGGKRDESTRHCEGLQDPAESVVSLPITRAQRKQRDCFFELEKSAVPLQPIKLFVTRLETLLEGSAIPFDVELREVGACKEESRGRDGLPNSLRDEIPVFVLNGRMHGGTATVPLTTDHSLGLIPVPQ
jgi:hypothetical protein